MREQGEYIQLGLFEDFSDELSFRKKKNKKLERKASRESR
jgi:hypothetical protein